MDPNVTRFHNQNGTNFHYNSMQHKSQGTESNIIFYRPYASNANPVNPSDNSRNLICNTNSINFRNSNESVIKNYRELGARQNYVPEVSNTYSNLHTHTQQNYGHVGSNVSTFSSVIQSTSQYETNFKQPETQFQERNSIQYPSSASSNLPKWEKNSNYFCKKLPDFSNFNVDAPNSKYQQISRVTTNQHYVQLTTTYPDNRSRDMLNVDPIPPYSSYSSNNAVISNYQNIPHTYRNTQHTQPQSLINCNVKYAKNINVAQQSNMPNNISNGGGTIYNSFPECPYVSYNAKPPININANTSNSSRYNTTNRSNSTSVPKPNYKEMINQVYTMKKSMTERDLNMRIIERTLLHNNNSSNNNNNNINNMRPPVTNYSYPSVNPPMHYENYTSVVSGYTPLDLSTKSVKSTADSTELPLEPRKRITEIRNSAPKLDFKPIVSQAAEKLLKSFDVPKPTLKLTTTTTPTASVINSAHDSSSSPRIRTKGELKVFNPNSIQYYQKPENNIEHKEDFFDLENETHSINLFDWDNTCNKLLNQLKNVNFQQQPFNNILDKQQKTSASVKVISNKKIVKRKHRRVLYNKKRLQTYENNSSDEESYDSLKLRKMESFRSWRRKKQLLYKTKNNNNQKNSNSNLQKTELKKQQIITEEEYKDSENNSVHNSSDIPSSISENNSNSNLNSNTISNSVPIKETNNKVAKIVGMVTRSKSMMTKKRFNFRKRYSLKQNDSNTNKQRGISLNRKRTNNADQSISKNKLQRSANEQIDWEVELVKHKKKSKLNLVNNKKVNKTNQSLDKEKTKNKLEDTIKESSKPSQVQQICNENSKDIVLENKNPTSDIKNNEQLFSSFERKYEEYISNVFKDKDIKSSNDKINIVKKRSCVRRKPSSGFDYIRKKKRTRPSTSSPTSSTPSIRKVKSFCTFNKKYKSENDIQSEIHKWVLNKSVGQTTLHKAARLGYVDVVCYCLERLNLNPNVKDNAGYTPLHEACSKGYIDIARCLLLYGADLSETAHSGIRPIHEASENGSIEIFRLLLQYGADPQITTYNGKSPYMLAENDILEEYMETFFKDLSNIPSNKLPWRFYGPWKSIDEFKDDEVEENITKTEDDLFEIEESDHFLPPVYKLTHISDNSPWMMLNDLSNLLNIKSKDKLLRHLYPSIPSTIIQKDLTIEIKIDDFLENAKCLQLLHAGEKINIQSSKLTLVKYNEVLKNVLKISNSVITL